MTTTKALALSVLLLVLSSTSAVGQRARIVGRVFVSGDSTRPVPDAELALLPTLRTVRSDSSGAFLFGDVSRGTYTIRVRRVGFDIFMQDVSVGAQQERTLRIPMRSGAQRLAEVTISGRRVLFPAHLSDAYARVARGRGAYFTREQIDSLQPYDAKSLLARLSGVRVNDRSVVFARCQSGAEFGSEGRVQVYVDGVRVTNKNATILGYDVNTAVKNIVLPSVQLIEVYTSISTIPVEYLDDACAVILVWTS